MALLDVNKGLGGVGKTKLNSAYIVKILEILKIKLLFVKLANVAKI
jgi:hypothetical protein